MIGAIRRLRDELGRRRVVRRMAGPKLLRAFARTHREVFFVVIGANDGEQHDPLRPYTRARGWRGVMVEPVPYVFERLRRNYGQVDGIELVEAAIAERDGPVEFHHLPPSDDPLAEGLPEWYDAIGSSSREAVLGHPEIPDAGERLVTTEVRGITFATLCRELGIDAIDLLLIDTEGYDAEVLRQVDFGSAPPRLVVYEHFHMSAAVRSDCEEALRAAGYETLAEHFDTYCLLPRDDRLTTYWRRLEPGVPPTSAEEERG